MRAYLFSRVQALEVLEWTANTLAAPHAEFASELEVTHSHRANAPRNRLPWTAAMPNGLALDAAQVIGSAHSATGHAPVDQSSGGR